MKIINHNIITALSISPNECYSWAEEMIKNKKEATLPAKISMSPVEGSFCNVMPSIVGKWGG